MKKILSIFLFVAFAASANAPATVTVPDASLGAVDYDVCYRLAGITTKVATATVTFVESEWDGRPAYHSLARIVTQPFFRLFLKPEYKAEAWYAREDLSPLYFTNPFTDGKKEGRYEVTYDNTGRTIRSAWTVEGEEPFEMTYDMGDKPKMELLSTLMFVRYHDFGEGTPVKIAVIFPSKARDAEISRVGDNLVLQIVGKGIMENGSGNRLLFRRSTDPDRRILRLETDLGSGTLICTAREQ